jgi:hypothetical protein
MAYCTGSGEVNGDHCCYVNGEVCPHLMDAGAIDAWITAQGWGATKTAAAREYAASIRWTCRIGIQVLADVNAARNNRARYEREFLSNADYQAFPAPAWREIEQRNGLAVGSMDCPKWQGEPTPEGGRTCCFRKTTAECDAEMAALGASTVAVSIRKAGARPD